MQANTWAEFFEKLKARADRRAANGDHRIRMFPCQRIYQRKMRLANERVKRANR